MLIDCDYKLSHNSMNKNKDIILMGINECKFSYQNIKSGPDNIKKHFSMQCIMQVGVNGWHMLGPFPHFIMSLKR